MVSWDDTKMIDGYPGDKVVIARRKGNQWYIGESFSSEIIQIKKGDVVEVVKL